VYHGYGGKVPMARAPALERTECIRPQQLHSILDFLPIMAVSLWKEWPKDMEAQGENTGGVFSLRGTCPHAKCGRASVFIQKATPYIINLGVQPGGFIKLRVAAVMECQGCQKLILGIVVGAQGSDRYVYQEHFPLGDPEQVDSPGIPDNVRADFNEALRCESVKAYNATVEMCRRALQTSCVEQGADPNLNLVAQIDWMYSQGKTTPLLKDMAHKVRLGGNRGAHSGDPSEPPILQPDAEAVVAFTREYLRHIYEVPQLLSKFDFSKAGAKASAASGTTTPSSTPPKKII
jgi:hypothetical protein